MKQLQQRYKSDPYISFSKAYHLRSPKLYFTISLSQIPFQTLNPTRTLYKSPATAPTSTANAAGTAVPIAPAELELPATLPLDEADAFAEVELAPADEEAEPDEAGEVASEPPTVEEPCTRRPPEIPEGWEPEFALLALEEKPA